VADIFGTAANDVLAGTTAADRIEGGAGNDRINGGAGDDEILGGLGADILTGDAGNDRIYGEDGNDGVYGGGGDDFVDGGVGDDIIFGDGGNDTLIGGVGSDRISGGIGNDTIDGGAGNDTLNGEAGDDSFIWRTGDGQDTIIGGGGNDRIELVLSSADMTAAVRADFAAYQVWAAQQAASAGSTANLTAQTTGANFTFASLGLTISVIETVAVKVDGKAVAIADLINSAPVANAAAQVTGLEDQVLSGVVAASDADGDTLSFVVATGPAKGAVSLDAATGRFTYTPAADLSGNDSFVVRVTDSRGASVVQTVNVAIAAVADAPKVVAADATVVLAQPIVGTDASDVIVGDSVPAMGTVAIKISTALTDVDGSETLAIRIAGVPGSGVLSAGAKQPDGTWLLTPAELADLMLTAPTDKDVSLTVTATAIEADGDSKSVSAELAVTFDRSGLGNDVIDAAGGHDIIDGGRGNDRLSGGAGNDVFVQRSGDGVDVLSGGDGHDVVQLALVATDVTPKFLVELANYKTWMDQGGQGSFTFGTLSLTVDTIEELAVTVDGRNVGISELLNVAPTAAATASITTAEDTAVQGNVLATDANGDVLTYVVEDGPAQGSVSIDANSGRYVYTPGQNVAGSDSFSVRVTDAFGASVVQTVAVGIEAKADTPIVSAAKSTAAVARISTLSGTTGNDIIRGDQYATTATFALVTTAALSDTDGSEALSIRISGVPAGATLSAGSRQSDGTWLLGSNDLTGLTITAPTARNFALRVTATAKDGANIAESSAVLNVAFTRGGSLNDTIIVSGGNDTYDGGKGTDSLDYGSVSMAATIDLGTGKASGPGNHTLTSIENVIGSSYDDVITGNAGNNVLDGGAGNDRINGGAGDDRVNGGAGNDLLTDAAGNDRYDGGTGDDVLTDSVGNDRYNGDAGNDVFVDAAGNDTYNGGTGDDVLKDGAGNDRYDGGAGYDVLDFSQATAAMKINAAQGSAAGMGSDRFSNIEKIVGSKFDDTFYGSTKADTFDGGAGNDWVRGDKGSDIFTGGQGNDTFVWLEKDVVSGKKSQGVDTITDFGVGDRLDLSDITDGLVAPKSGASIDSSSVIKVTDSSAGSMLSVKVGSSFYDVVLLQNVHGVTTQSLLADGYLIV
jgi:Ca2+-binding RTX toxin-like protein